MVQKKPSRDEIAHDIKQIRDASDGTCEACMGDVAFVEDMRMKGDVRLKRYKFDGKDWAFICRDNVDAISTFTNESIVNRKVCIQEAKQALDLDDIEGAIKVLEGFKQLSVATVHPKKVERTRSVYSAFLSTTMLGLSASHPTVPPKERMRMALGMWKDHKGSSASV